MADDTLIPAAIGRSPSSILARPQPLGVFPLPAGYLLIPSSPELDDVRELLVAGRLPDEFPDGLRFYELALEGDLDGAVVALGASDDLIARTNRLVLDPSPADFDALVDDLTSAGEIDLLAIAETLGFIVGLRRTPPDDRADASLDGEIASLVLAARATVALEAGDRAGALDELEAAARAAVEVSRPLAGQLMGQIANVQLDEGGVQRASITLQSALDHLAGTDLHISQAELHVAAGAMYQEMSDAAPRLMQNAINHYHQALALVTANTAPETFAIANANLGLAYLTMPMNEASDQLRVGVAVQSMREALNHFTPETHPDRWSSTQLNLANALVYMPSTHQADNIAEAVGLYEGVLQYRDRATDPLGRARVLANQGNALAHLGIFADAKSKLDESRAIFEEFEEDDAVRSVRSVLDEIARQEAIIRQDAEHGAGGT